MNKAANSYWLDSRLTAQRPLTRSLTMTPSPYVAPLDATATRAQVRRRTFTVPPWVVFTMIVLATFAVCATVTMRTHAEMQGAADKFQQMSADVEKLRNTNASLERDVQRLRNDPRAIEAAARTRLNMVRAGEVVVPVR